MYCYNCGKESAETVKFCPYCGAEQKQPQQSPQWQQPQQPVQQPQQQEGDGGGREPFPPGAAFSFGFTHFVCHSAHLSVM